ncbi:MAG TPA: hypothetical protein VEA16_06435 [Vicinamibacterales bacterium]|nr:hypothetical protein [Vicinamibacterales bacterium]
MFRGAAAFTALVGVVALALSAPMALAGSSGVAGGGVTGLSSCAGGDALADNEVMRADGTTGCQGSTVTLSDANIFTATSGNVAIASASGSTFTVDGASVASLSTGSHAELKLIKGAADNFNTLGFYVGATRHFLLQHDNTGLFHIKSESGDGIRVDASSTAGQTRLLVYDVDNGTVERVTVGAADSCGSGFKCLRIPN